MKCGIIIQARMGSTRLPGKILKPFYDEQRLLDVLLENLHKIENAKVIVATSLSSNNDELVSYLQSRNELVFRGSENDVLNRFISAAEVNDVDRIIRICSDNPFMDVSSLQQLVKTAIHSDADYIGFRINDTPSIKTHFGFWGEYVTLDALKRVQSTTEVDSPAHEHVTIHIYTHPEEYKCEWIECPNFLQGREDIRLTIDTAEDFINAQKVYSELKEKCGNFELKDVVEYLDNHKELTQSMKEIINCNKK